MLQNTSRNWNRRARSALSLALAAVVCSAACADDADSGPELGLPDPHPGSRDVIVHLFQWPWESIASECTDELGPRGFGAVQVSPPQEHVILPGLDHPWWQDYQPVSYQLVTRRGDRTAFAAMVEACHAAGVRVYVDAVVNHMAGGGSTGPGSSGSTFTHYDYPAAGYGEDDFHHCARNGTDDIVDWRDAYEVRNCELLDLADLATGSTHVRAQLAAYLDDLMALGVDGFRIDAAKHVPPDDLAELFAALAETPIVFQEVIEGGPGEISPLQYVGTGDVTEFRYGDVVGPAFRDGDLAGLDRLADQMLVDSGDAIAFIDNHDTQRNGRSPLTHADGAPYALAEAFMLAWPHGTPHVMSSYAFESADQGPPADASGHTAPVDCADGWVCEHRWPTIAGMVGFHNQVHGTRVTDWWADGDRIAFGRESAGFVVFNRRGESTTETFQTGLAPGLYCDVAGGALDGEGCTGAEIEVDADGRFTATVEAGGMLALHAGAVHSTGP